MKKTRILPAKRRQKGFSLVELLVALAILALISAIVVINVLPARDKAAVDTAKIDIGVIESALDQYRLDMMNYPTSQQGLEALIRALLAQAEESGNGETEAARLWMQSATNFAKEKREARWASRSLCRTPSPASSSISASDMLPMMPIRMLLKW